jgi:hypothetical protein
MITPEDCITKYGKSNLAFERKWMTLYIVPKDLRNAISALPGRIYMNKDFVKPFEDALYDLCNSGGSEAFQEFGGCFNRRLQHGTGVNGVPPVWSLHAWGIACDINVPTNPEFEPSNQPPILIAAFKDNGFDWGGDFTPKRIDPMHFQLQSI